MPGFFITIALLTIASLAIVLVAICLVNKKEDVGGEFHGEYFVAYVRRNRMYTANIHDGNLGKALVAKLRSGDYIELQRDVQRWIKKRG